MRTVIGSCGRPRRLIAACFLIACASVAGLAAAEAPGGQAAAPVVPVAPAATVAPAAPTAPVAKAATAAPAAPGGASASTTSPPPKWPASDACVFDAARVSSVQAERAFTLIVAASPPLEQVRVLAGNRFMPANAQTDVYAVKVDETAVRYRVFISNDDAPMQLTLLDDRRVWAERAPLKSKGIDNGSLDDASPKTLIHFTPPVNAQWVYWEKRRVHVLACGAGNVPLYQGQFQTYLTTKNPCRILAVLMCLLFYALAAWSSHRIHMASRDPDAKLAATPRPGTNYATLAQHFNPVVMTANQSGQGSATKLQILFFSLLIFGVVAYIWMVTGNFSELSDSILILMGISGIGATAAAATEVSRKRLTFENWAWLIDRKWLPSGGAAEVNRAQWKDIFMTNSEFDVSRFQMITFSFLVGLSLLAAGGETANLADFTVPDTFLGILGLSQAVYVAGKLVDGPSIEQLDKQIDTLRAAETTLSDALADAGKAGGMQEFPGLRLTRHDLPPTVLKAYDAYMEAWERTSTMFKSTLSKPVSAVAQGYRPPFPHLSLPVDVLAALQAKYAVAETALQALPDNVDNAKRDAIATAREAYTKALQEAQKALDEYKEAHRAVESVDALRPDEADKRFRKIASTEAIVRQELDRLRSAVTVLANLGRVSP